MFMSHIFLPPKIKLAFKSAIGEKKYLSYKL